MIYTRPVSEVTQPAIINHALCLRPREEHGPTSVFFPTTGISIDNYRHPRRTSTVVLSAAGRREAVHVNGTCKFEEEMEKKKPRALCLHGFRTSGEIMSTQMKKWPAHILDRLDLVFPDGLYPAQGPSAVEGLFPPPYYEWFQFNKERTQYKNLFQCLEFIEEYMVEHGPFDGLIGFSQGAYLSGALPGLQSKGYALTRVPSIKFVMLISGAKFPTKDAAKAYTPPMNIPSLHFLGEMDTTNLYGSKLVEAFVDPCVIYHPKGHTVPRLDEKAEKMVMNFIDKIQNVVHYNASSDIEESLKEASMLPI